MTTTFVVACMRHQTRVDLVLCHYVRIVEVDSWCGFLLQLLRIYSVCNMIILLNGLYDTSFYRHLLRVNLPKALLYWIMFSYYRYVCKTLFIKSGDFVFEEIRTPCLCICSMRWSPCNQQYYHTPTHTKSSHSHKRETLSLGLMPWASYQIRKIAGCACARNAGNVFPRRRFQRKPLVSDPVMHHGTCVTHVPSCMSGSLTCGDRENLPGTPGACARAI